MGFGDTHLGALARQGGVQNISVVVNNGRFLSQTSDIDGYGTSLTLILFKQRNRESPIKTQSLWLI